jgi:hypothetical protein
MTTSTNPLRRWAREPLVHFIVAGAILFGASYAFRDAATAPADDTTIVVDRRALMTFLQYRANAFEPETFSAALDAMSDAELQELIDAYVDEEALYREAKALGLEDSDYVIRQRMVQKMTFLMGDIADPGGAIDDEVLATYFAENREAYAVQPWATFTHVFFDASKRGDEGARADAETVLRELNESGALFNDAPSYGDRFPFLLNYVERTFEYIASHFGYEFVAEIAELEPSAERWQGPFRSAYGQHLIMLTRRAERSYPELDEVRGDVEADYLSERNAELLAEMTATIRERYRVDVRNIRQAAP